MRDYAVVYARFILLTMPFKAAGTALSCILRFQGYSKRSMYGLGSGAVLNIFLDPIADVRLWNGICRSRRRHHDR